MTKHALRQALLARRKALTPAMRAAASTNICHQLQPSNLPTAVYLAGPDEPDLTDFIRAAIARGQSLAAPRWNGTDYELAELNAYWPDALVKGPHAILEPPQAAPRVEAKSIGTWLVPGLAFTSAGARLGYGGGWYDRLLAQASRDARKIGIGYRFQIVPALPEEPHDIRLDQIITDLSPHLILAPLRGVTIRCFRETFADEIAAAGFTEAFTPFIPATRGYNPLHDRELAPQPSLPLLSRPTFSLTPQFIGKDPAALGEALRRVKDAGYLTADLNAGCPYPMVRNKGRGSGLLRTRDILRRMLDVGCEVMGPGRFSVKTRLGIERRDELLTLMPLFNDYPLRFLTVHARTARQMYGGACDHAAFAALAAVAKIPLVYNGDLQLSNPPTLQPSNPPTLMLGRAFIRDLGERPNASELALRYLEASARELTGDAPVLGRLKELLAYWRFLPAWHRRWSVIKLTRTLPELRSTLI